MNKRSDCADLVKGIGILLVCMGHMGFFWLFDWYVHAFHMMMFFMVSGCFFVSGKYRFGDYVRRKARTILLPYAVFGAVNYVLWLLLFRKEGQNITDPLRHLLFENTTGLPIAGALWFLTALFFCEMISWWLDRLFSSCPAVRALAAAAVAAAGHLFCLYLPFRLPWALDAAMVGTGMFEIGRRLADFERSHKGYLNSAGKKERGVLAVLFVLFSAACFLNRNVNMRLGEYHIIPLFWFNAVSMSLMIWVISGIITADGEKGDGRLLTRKWVKAGLYLLKEIGRNSIVFVVISQAVTALVMLAAGRLPGPSFIGKLVGFAVSMGLVFLAARVLTTTRLRVLIGKQKGAR